MDIVDRRRSVAGFLDRIVPLLFFTVVEVDATVEEVKVEVEEVEELNVEVEDMEEDEGESSDGSFLTRL